MLVAVLVVLVLSARPGVPPDTPWSCPATHPIKGYVSADLTRRIYHVPGSLWYEETSPERCYATEGDARRDGGHPFRVPGARPSSEDLV